jgi:hypothetical protein
METRWLKRNLAMDRPVREHIQALEEKRNLLSAQVMDESNAGRRNELQTELRAVESALRFYHDALETERRFWGSAAGG